MKDWGQWRADVFGLTLSELQHKYGKPKDERSHKQLKRYYGKKGYGVEREQPDKTSQFEALLERSGIQPNDVAAVTRMNVWQAAIKNSEGEFETTDLYAMQIKPKGEHEESFPAAQAAKITPTRRKPVERDHDILFVFGDAQIDYRRIIDSKTGAMELVPLHDERVLRAAQLMCRALVPQKIINLGDTVDNAALSKYDPDSDHFHKTLGPSFQRAHDMYAQFRADNPDADIIELDSNHNVRLRNFVLKKMPQFHDIRRAGDDSEYPLMTYPYLANLGRVGVKFIDGYGEAEYVHGAEYDAPPIHFKHGSTSVPGSTAAKESKNYPHAHIVRGHSHRADRVYTTVRGGPYRGHYLASIVVGAACKITGEVPGFHSAVDDRNRPVQSLQNWQQGFLVIRDYRNGRYEFQDVMVQDGVAYFEGRAYDGNEAQ